MNSDTLLPSSTSRTTRWAAALIGLASTAVLLMHGYLGTYSRLMADDFCSASVSLKLGVLRAAWFWYLTWTGRYSANVLDGTFGALGPAVTPVVTALVLALWLASLYGAFLIALRTLSARSQPLLSFALASTVLFLTLAIAPNVPQALYWGQGMRAVVPPLIVFTFDVYIFLYCRRRAWSPRATILWMVLSFILAFGAGGFSETYAALQVVIFGLALAGLLLARSASRQDWLFIASGLIGALLSVAAIVLSPGNPARAAFYPPPPALPKLLGIAFTSYGIFLTEITNSPTKIIAIIAALALGIWLGVHVEIGPRGWRAAAAILLLGAILSFSCFPPAAYGESTVPPDRTLLIPTYILVLTALFFGASVSQPLVARWNDLRPLSNIAILILWTAAVLSLSQMIAAQPAYAAYARAWARFDTQMVDLRQKGFATAVISTADQKASNWSALNTLGDTTRFWLNKCVGDYYGIKVISTTP